MVSYGDHIVAHTTSEGRNDMILITGATGAIGIHVATALSGREDVRALAHSDRSVATLEGLGVRDVVQGDLSSPPPTVFEGVSALFLLTPSSAQQVAQETCAIDLALAAGAQRIVKVSAREVETGRELFFADSILAIETHLERAGVDATILRPDHFMTNLLTQVDPLRGGQVVYPGGEGALAWIDPRDIAAVAVEALTAPAPVTGTLTLTGPQALTFPALAGELSTGLGRRIAFVDLPNDAWRDALSGAGVPPETVRLLGDMFASVAARTHPTVTTDVARVTGRPPTGLADWAAEVLAPALQEAEAA